MNRRPRAGFTLAEVLIALVVAGLVTGVAISMLYTTRQVALEMERPLYTETTAFLETLRSDLDRILPKPPFEDVDPIRLDPEQGMTLVALSADAQGIPHPYQLHYLLEGNDLYRISEGGIPSLTQTNRVLTAVRSFQLSARASGTAYELWPGEDLPALPQRLDLQLRRSTGEEIEASFDLPAAFRVKAASSETPENN